MTRHEEEKPIRNRSISDLDGEALGPRLHNNSDKYVQKISDRMENLERLGIYKKKSQMVIL